MRDCCCGCGRALMLRRHERHFGGAQHCAPCPIRSSQTSLAVTLHDRLGGHHDAAVFTGEGSPLYTWSVFRKCSSVVGCKETGLLLHNGTPLRNDVTPM